MYNDGLGETQTDTDYLFDIFTSNPGIIHPEYNSSSYNLQLIMVLASAWCTWLSQFDSKLSGGLSNSALFQTLFLSLTVLLSCVSERSTLYIGSLCQC